MIDRLDIIIGMQSCMREWSMCVRVVETERGTSGRMLAIVCVVSSTLCAVYVAC